MHFNLFEVKHKVLHIEVELNLFMIMIKSMQFCKMNTLDCESACNVENKREGKFTQISEKKAHFILCGTFPQVTQKMIFAFLKPVFHQN